MPRLFESKTKEKVEISLMKEETKRIGKGGRIDSQWKKWRVRKKRKKKKEQCKEVKWAKAVSLHHDSLIGFVKPDIKQRRREVLQFLSQCDHCASIFQAAVALALETTSPACQNPKKTRCVESCSKVSVKRRHINVETKRRPKEGDNPRYGFLQGSYKVVEKVASIAGSWAQLGGCKCSMRRKARGRSESIPRMRKDLGVKGS